MMTSETIGEIGAALAKAQGSMSAAIKDSTNPHFRSKYVSLGAVVDVARPALSANGIAYVQMPGQLEDEGITLTTMLVHSSGEWLSEAMTIPVMKRDAQGIGSALTYGRRYALMAACGIPAEDDDGNAAVAPAPQSPQPTPSFPELTEEQYQYFEADCEIAQSVDKLSEICEVYGTSKADPRIAAILKVNIRRIKGANG